MQIYILPLLLDQHSCLCNVAVDKLRGAFSCLYVIDLDTAFKADILFGFAHAVDLLQKRKPEGLSLLLFVSASLPIRRELPCCDPLFRVFHYILPSELQPPGISSVSAYILFEKLTKVNIVRKFEG